MNKTKLRLQKIENKVGVVALGLFILLLLMMICPVVMVSQSLALDGADFNQSAWRPHDPSSISVNLAEMPELNIAPAASGSAEMVSAQLRVETTSNAGYKIYVNSLNETNVMHNVDNTKNNTISALEQDAVMSNFMANTWGYALTTQTPTDDTLYHAMPTTVRLERNEAKGVGEYYLSFAAKVDASLPAGQYENTVMISVIANPNIITGMMDLVYMQDMTQNVCKNTMAADANSNRDSNGSYIVVPGNEPTKQLIDTRDGKEYWVAKLADGNCWMTQNLALTFGAGTGEVAKLTSDDTDLNTKREWILLPEGDSRLGGYAIDSNYAQYGTYTEKSVPSQESGSSHVATRSWHLGEYVLATPSRAVGCNLVLANGVVDDTKSVLAGQKIDDNCTDFVKVSEKGWRPLFDSNESGFGSTWTGSIYDTESKIKVPYTYNKNDDGYGLVALEKGNNVSEADAFAETEGNSYDSHYLIGNYYQFNTATAGTGGTDLVSTGADQDASKLKDAPDSICPKGWKLPSAGRNIVTGFPFDQEDSFYRLLLAYGYPEGDKYTPDNKGNSFTSILDGSYRNGKLNTIAYSNINVNDAAHQNLALSPFYLVRGGRIFLPDGALLRAGFSNSDWSSSAYVYNINTNLYAYEFRINGVFYYAANDSNRYNGYSIRCMVR